MLTALSIRDVVLIDRLDLAFDQGLTVLTGETGAGKSILLDSLGLALGARAEAAWSERPRNRPASPLAFRRPTIMPWRVLDRARAGGRRRNRAAPGCHQDGRSRAFINDHPVGVGLLRRVGALLVEVQGQHEQMSLADPASHAGLLDAFGVPTGATDRGIRSVAGVAGCAAPAGTRARGHRRCRTRRGMVAPRGRGTCHPGTANRMKKNTWRANVSGCSRTNGRPRRSPRPSRN